MCDRSVQVIGKVQVASLLVELYMFFFNHLDCLLKFQLMNYSEFRVMTTALEKYYKDVKIAILTGKRDAKDLDLRYTFRCNVPPL